MLSTSMQVVYVIDYCLLQLIFSLQNVIEVFAEVPPRTQERDALNDAVIIALLTCAHLFEGSHLEHAEQHQQARSLKPSAKCSQLPTHTEVSTLAGAAPLTQVSRPHLLLNTHHHQRLNMKLILRTSLPAAHHSNQ